MEIQRYLRILRRWWWLLLVAVVLAAGSSYAVTRTLPRTYSSRARVMVGESIQSRNPDYLSISTAQQLAPTYAELATTRPVLQGVVDRLGLATSPEVLAGRVAVQLVQGTQILDITVVDTDPVRAAAIANAVAEELIRKSPGGADSPEAGIRRDVEEQIRDLKERIDFAKEEIQNLEAAILEEDSARAIAELKNRRDLLQQQINQWQATYAQLYSAYTGNQVNSLSLVDPAVPNYRPIGPRTTMNVVLAGLVGGLLAVGAILALEYLDDTIKSGEELNKLSRLPFLGIVPRMPDADALPDRLVALHQPRSNFAECFRVLRTNLQFASPDRPLQTILVTSPQPTEGKSTTAANLAVALAQAGRRVLLVDSDLRRPILHRILDQPNDWGLTTLLFSSSPGESNGILPTTLENLHFIPSGPLPPNPAEVLDSSRFEAFLEQIKEQADLIIFDSPPLLTVADAAVLASKVDGVILVTDCGVTRRDAIGKAVESLRQVGASPLGTILNRVDARSDGYYYYYYSHYYTDESGQPTRQRRKRRKKRGRRSAARKQS